MLRMRFQELRWASPSCRFGLFDKIVVRAGEGVAVIFVERAVETVGAALGDESDLSAGRTAAIGVVVGGGDAEFLDRVRERREGRT